MKSPLIADAKDRKLYGELKVMKSNAGYYIGSEYANPDGYTEPGTRDSPYYADSSAAEFDLSNNCWNQRTHS